MKDLKDIILNSEQIHEYRIKFAFEPSEKDVTRIKQILEKYDLLDAGYVKRTIFQSRPLDFYNLDCGEIYIMDISVKRGIQDQVLLHELGAAMHCSEALIRVRNKNSLYQEAMEAQEDDLELDEYIEISVDGSGPELCPDRDQYAGDDFVDAVVKAAVDDYSKERTPYSDFMVAGFEAMYPKAASDVAKDAGPRKE